MHELLGGGNIIILFIFNLKIMKKKGKTMNKMVQNRTELMSTRLKCNIAKG